MLAGLQGFARPPCSPRPHAFSTRLFNLIVTNVPGPQFPLYMLGRELREIVPMAFLPEDHALAVAIMSYNGGVDFGLLGDYDALPDIEEFGEFIEQSSTSCGRGRESAPAARKPARGATPPHETAARGPVAQPQRLLARQNPSANLASSLARSGDHGGGNTISG